MTEDVLLSSSCYDNQRWLAACSNQTLKHSGQAQDSEILNTVTWLLKEARKHPFSYWYYQCLKWEIIEHTLSCVLKAAPTAQVQPWTALWGEAFRAGSATQQFDSGCKVRIRWHSEEGRRNHLVFNSRLCEVLWRERGREGSMKREEEIFKRCSLLMQCYSKWLQGNTSCCCCCALAKLNSS